MYFLAVSVSMEFEFPRGTLSLIGNVFAEGREGFEHVF